MSIANEIAKLRGHLSDAYASVSTKGGTVPASQTMNNLPAAIESITGGAAAFTNAEFNNILENA